MRPRRIERLQRTAIRKAVRTSRKLHHALTKDEILGLRIQIVPATARILLATGGILLITAALISWPSDSNVIQGLEFLAGIFLLLFGIFGIRRTLSELADQMSYKAFELLLEGILSAIGNATDL